MKKMIISGTIAIVLLIYGLYLSQYQITVTRPQIGIQNPEGLYDYKGLTHVHSRESTGSGTYDEILEAASQLDFDFVFFTEVNPVSPLSGMEGYRQNILVLSGGEYSYLDSRLMYYGGLPTDPPEGKAKSQAYFADLLSQENKAKESGFIFLAHPFHTRYQWIGDYPPGLDGIEIINLKRVLEAAWIKSKLNSFYSLLLYAVNPNLALIRLYSEPSDEIFLWDELNKKRKTVGILGSDATAKAVILPGFNLKFPSYETLFAIGSDHVLINSELVGDPERDRIKILNALRDGQFYMCLDIVANPKGFYAKMKSFNKDFLMGSTVPLGKETKFTVQLPSFLEVPFEVRIYKDGELYSTSNSTKTDLTITAPGVYRAVVRVIPSFAFPEGKRWISWIYTNSFYVVD